MVLNDTVELMNSSNYQDRFVAEYMQLWYRMEKLRAMLDKYRANELNFTPKCSYDLLHEQYVHMKGYLVSLTTRATVEGIELPKFSLD